MAKRIAIGAFDVEKRGELWYNIFRLTHSVILTLYNGINVAEVSYVATKGRQAGAHSFYLFKADARVHYQQVGRSRAIRCE